MIKPDDRQRILTETRNLKMAQSAHAYVRGSTVRFYDWLESSSRGKLPEGPPVWICGDCHVGNLGPLADTKGHVLVQIRNLDQTVIGNSAHDLVRLGLSLASAARGSDLPGVTTARILEEVVAGYQAALLTNLEVNSGAAGAVHAAPMAPFGGGAARRRQAHHSPRQAVLGADAGRTQGPAGCSPAILSGLRSLHFEAVRGRSH